MKSDWSGEVLIPAANIEGYGLVYEAETWLRRICLAALMLAEGPAWASSLDPQLRSRLEAESMRHGTRWYLGIDAEEELLWASTHGQLARVLQLSAIAHAVQHLCGARAVDLADRLRSIALVRNALAHNRAISDATLTILQSDLVAIRSAVDEFKVNTLYAESEIHLRDYPSDLKRIGSEFDRLADAAVGQQMFLSANDDFVFLVRLPVDPFGRWPRGDRIRDGLGVASRLLLCVLANKTGDEVQFVIPRSLAYPEMSEVTRRFVGMVSVDPFWTDVPPTAQHPANSSWPRLWFYENS